MTRSSRKKTPPSRTSGGAELPSFEAVIEDSLGDPAFRAAWEATESKRRVVAALLRLRAEANLSQKELAGRTGWSPAFVSRLESFPGQGEKLYMPDLATLETYATACGREVSLVFGRAKGRGARFEVAATTSFGDKAGFSRALAALAGTEISLARGGAPRIGPGTKRAGATVSRAPRR